MARLQSRIRIDYYNLQLLDNFEILNSCIRILTIYASAYLVDQQLIAQYRNNRQIIIINLVIA